MLLYILGFVVVAILFLAFWFNPSTRAKGNLPPIYGKIPIIGCMPEFSPDPIGTVKKVQQMYKDCFTLHLAGFNMTFLIGSDAHAAFFKATDEELSQREAYKFVTPVFGPGVVFDSPVQVMYEQIKFIKSGLVANNLKKYVPVIEAEAREFFDTNWKGNSGEIDFLYDLNKLTIITASRCLLGKEIRSDPKVASEFVDLYHDLEGGLNPVAFFFPHLPIPQHIKRDRARERVTEIFLGLIKQRRSVPDHEKPDDMLQVLMEAEYKGGIQLDDRSICGLLIGLLFAGQHTSGITSCWTGFFLLKHRQYLDELIQEQNAIIKDHGKEISYDTLKKSVMLENCIREALRLFPPLIFLMRKCKKDMAYKDYVIPAGDLVCVSPGNAMRLPELYTNPDTYDPHRYDRGEDKNLPYAYIPFGGGRHGCPGENFGITQIKTIWTVLLREYEFEFGKQGFPNPDYTSLVVGPRQPALIKYKKRAVPLDGH